MEEGWADEDERSPVVVGGAGGDREGREVVGVDELELDATELVLVSDI